VRLQSHVVLTNIFVSDSGHNTSQKVLEDIAIKRKQKLYAYSFTLVETCNIICRRIITNRWRPIDPLQDYVVAYKKLEEKCCLLLSIVINFLREKLHVEFIEEEDLYDLVSMGFNKLRIPRCLRNR
jgi:hypothetical protein